MVYHDRYFETCSWPYWIIEGLLYAFLKTGCTCTCTYCELFAWTSVAGGRKACRSAKTDRMWLTSDLFKQHDETKTLKGDITNI